MIDFYLWSRTVKLAKSSKSKYPDYFLEYSAESVKTHFAFSDLMKSDQLGLTLGKDFSFTLSDIDGLTRVYKVGMV